MAEEKHEKKAHKHLHEIRSVQAEDGSIVHHHTYKNKREDAHAEPERQNVATSSNADEAGQHVADQMGMNEPAADPSQAGMPPAASGGGPVDVSAALGG